MPNKNSKNRDLWRYAGLTVQIFAGLALGVAAGIKLDRWLAFSTPVFVWVLPLIIMTGIIYKLIRETGVKNDRK